MLPKKRMRNEVEEFFSESNSTLTSHKSATPNNQNPSPQKTVPPQKPIKKPIPKPVPKPISKPTIHYSSHGQLWVDKYAPNNQGDLIGNKTVVKHFETWLQDWDDVVIKGHKKPV